MTSPCRFSGVQARPPAARKGVLAAALFSIGLSASACSVGPKYVRPDLALPDRIVEAPSDTAPAWPTADWWRGFGSAELAALEERAQSANYDIAAAVARIREA